MDLRKIKTLIDLLEGSNLSEIEITEGDDSIRLSRASTVAPMMAAPVAAIAPAMAAAAPAASEAAPAALAGHGVESPTVGTFYARSSPDSDPFVQVGDTVTVGTTLCVVEAMKTFNEIQADKAGKIIEVLKTDGDPVEFGEILFVIA
ncbi:MAG: acetyl-CoA carboxylase biotin carboxyl carrier protein [Arenicellales bacterium]